MKTNLTWLEATIKISEEAAEALVEQLVQLGAFGIATRNPFEITRIIRDSDTTIFVDPDFIQGLPDFVEVKAYFAQNSKGISLIPCLEQSENPFYEIEARLYHKVEQEYCSLNELRDRLEKIINDLSLFLEVGDVEVAINEVQEEDWANNWKQYYQPIEISDTLVICPSWLTYDLKPGQIEIKMDPGSAFGTGNHETTVLCLKLLSQNINPDTKLLDLGCGSGILAIAAAKLGVKNVLGVDIDEGAVKVSIANAALNDCRCQTDFKCSELKHLLPETYDVIVANLLAEVLVAIEADLRQATKPGSKVICSGIVNHKLDLVRTAFASPNWLLEVEEHQNDWVALVFVRR